MINGCPLPKRYYHNGFWLSRYGAVDMLLYLWVSDKCPYCYKRKLCGKKQVPSYSLLQFVVMITASDGDCYISNFRPRQCGLFIVILSSTLSLKTVHRTVFLTVAFKSRYHFACKTKKQTNKKVNLFFMVRVTGLEPVRRETHAPQTCLSAYSSTLAFISHFFREQY